MGTQTKQEAEQQVDLKLQCGKLKPTLEDTLLLPSLLNNNPRFLFTAVLGISDLRLFFLSGESGVSLQTI